MSELFVMECVCVTWPTRLTSEPCTLDSKWVWLQCTKATTHKYRYRGVLSVTTTCYYIKRACFKKVSPLNVQPVAGRCYWTNYAASLPLATTLLYASSICASAANVVTTEHCVLDRFITAAAAAPFYLMSKQVYSGLEGVHQIAGVASNSILPTRCVVLGLYQFLYSLLSYNLAWCCTGAQQTQQHNVHVDTMHRAQTTLTLFILLNIIWFLFKAVGILEVAGLGGLLENGI